MNSQLQDLKQKYDEELTALQQKYIELFKDNREQLDRLKDRISELNRPEQEIEKVGEIIVRKLK